MGDSLSSRKVDEVKHSKKRDSPLLSRKKGREKKEKKNGGKHGGAGKHGGSDTGEGKERGGGEGEEEVEGKMSGPADDTPTGK